MEIKLLKERPELSNQKKHKKAYDRFNAILEELRKKDIPEGMINTINKYVDEIDAVDSDEKNLKKLLRKKQTSLLQLLEKELKIVPKNKYMTLWMALGMSFGIPIGVAFGSALGSMAYLGLGLPIGMSIGLAIGSSMDKKAKEEGRQLDVNLGS